jgi:ubiquinone/menaquinone biosynthesis C-methylase UbiE
VSDTNRFDEAATTWDEQPRRVTLARAVADEITRQIPLSRDIDVLDFGCGTGLLTLALPPFVRSVTGADTSAGMLEVLRRKVRSSSSPGRSPTEPRLPTLVRPRGRRGRLRPLRDGVR